MFFFQGGSFANTNASPMRLTGTLRSWNDDRGFGFIAPRHGGVEVFVHISALPRDGTRPTVGETVTYELGRGRDGNPQAVKVMRQAVGAPSDAPRRSHPPRSARRSVGVPVIALVMVVALAGWGWRHYESRARGVQSLSERAPFAAAEEAAPSPSERFHCDGRTHCSQMTSCAEAKFFLKNCPGVQMDGNHDGEPCEQQWCTHPFAD
ncbi:cold shock domain-containing protein [Ideonella sp.]|uniref:cold shock domain-containing protein n=1 Tax=Ideonella sp. TaxID=1929293 RepID=UPI002B49C5B1|nr:cold shock domain-containing protein [Ideonella sp.]HJV70257.1 cold shock domain-containing protein [Ideonella sp.]